jgi:hypothetical protein
MSRSRVVLAGAVGIVALAGGALWALGNAGTESSTDTSATPPEPVFPCVTAITEEPRPSRRNASAGARRGSPARASPTG